MRRLFIPAAIAAAVFLPMGAANAAPQNGFYVGVNAGYDLGDTATSTTVTAGSYFAGTSVTSINSSSPTNLDKNGFIGGGQLGFLYSHAGFAWGAEADFNWMGRSQSSAVTVVYPCCGPTSYTSGQFMERDWLATVRARGRRCCVRRDLLRHVLAGPDNDVHVRQDAHGLDGGRRSGSSAGGENLRKARISLRRSRHRDGFWNPAYGRRDLAGDYGRREIHQSCDPRRHQYRLLGENREYSKRVGRYPGAFRFLHRCFARIGSPGALGLLQRPRPERVTAMTSTLNEKIEKFRKLHKRGDPFIMPNAWDAGSARILAGLGFPALATTSAGFALTLGRRDYGVTRDEALAHARLLAGAVDIPVSADLENGFGVSPEDAAVTIRAAAQTGLAGGSIEDTSGDPTAPILDAALAAERIAAAVEAARDTGFVLTARAEGFLWGRDDLDDVIARLQAFEAAGADVLFAPGLPDLDAVRAVCSSVTRPVNVLVIGALAASPLEELARAGAARISLGGALAFSAYGSLVLTAEKALRAGAFSALAENAAGARRIREWLA
jgi:2-methylisocitrate lyase-like PEP mutase family enzyme